MVWQYLNKSRKAIASNTYAAALPFLYGVRVLIKVGVWTETQMQGVESQNVHATETRYGLLHKATLGMDAT